MNSAAVCGVILVDKQAGMTSHDVVAAVRRLTGIRKVGHGGTLDPFATGLLLILVGRATRLFDLLITLRKEYRVTVRFGAVSTTGDSDGEVTPAVSAPAVTRAALEAVLPDFTGEIEQRVPAYSAVKQGGERLYRKARRGETVVAPLRRVRIHRLQLLSFDAASQQAELLVSCSKGTYIRALCEDIGRVLDGGAYAAALRRTAVGEFTVSRAASLDSLSDLSPADLPGPASPSFLSCLSALYFLPVRELDPREATAVGNGRFIAGEAEGPVRLASGGRLLAVYGPAAEAGLLRPLVVLS